ALTDELPFRTADHGGSGRIHEVDAIGGIDADDAIGNGVKDEGFLPVELANAEFLTGAGDELAKGAADGLHRGEKIGIFGEDLAVEAFDDVNDLIAYADGHRPSGKKAVEAGGSAPGEGRVVTHLVNPVSFAQGPDQPRKALPEGGDLGERLTQQLFAGAAAGQPGSPGANDVLGFVDDPQGGKLAAEGGAERLEDAGQTFIKRSGFGDDLADHQLNAEAALAAVLLGNIAEG